VIAHARARQVHDGVDTGQGRVTRVRGARVPAHLFTGALAVTARRPPDEADDLVAVRPQAGRQRGTD
jgi:hypothetical protein